MRHVIRRLSAERWRQVREKPTSEQPEWMDGRHGKEQSAANGRNERLPAVSGHEKLQELSMQISRRSRKAWYRS